MNVREKAKKLDVEKRAFVNGRYVNAIDGDIIIKTSSIDGSDLSGIVACNEKDISKAVEVAKKAYESHIWSGMEISQRKGIMLKLAGLMEKNREELALLDTLETGRAYKNYYNDSIPKAIEAIRYFAESIDKYYDYTIPVSGTEYGMVVRVPLGVVGIITPWNDPLVVASWKFAPALLMGNSVILKPAEQSSLSILKVAALAKEAGIPDGVFNVLPGYGEKAGKALALNNDVQGIYFTGSSSVGKKLLTYSGQSNMKKVYLECGGKSPYIVSSKCKDLKEAAQVLAKNMFYNQGQICSAPSRVIVEKSVKDEFIMYLKEAMEQYVPGDPFETENEVGCIVSREQFEKVNGYIELAKSEGANVYQALGEKYHNEKACCIKPTIILDISIKSKVVTEEIFGPVAVILEVENVMEAIDVANNTKYGLAAAIWTNDFSEVNMAVKALEAGLVHINSYGNDDNRSPFGGMKESGIGKDKSMFAFDEFSELKSIWVHCN